MTDATSLAVPPLKLEGSQLDPAGLTLECAPARCQFGIATKSNMNSRVIATMILAGSISTGSILAEDKPDLKDPKLRASYAIGVDIGTSMKKQELDIDAKVLALGIQESFNGKPSLTEEDIKAALNDFRTSMMQKMQAKEKVAGDKNKKAGEDFLAANAKKEGVKSTKSGLQYRVIKSGTGKTPKSSDTVKVHYHGTLIDGSVFDSSVERNDPATFPVDGVIPGWTEALQLMKEGDKWQIVLPSAIAYGERGAGGKIGPNSVLVFDVELLAIEKAN